MELISNLYMLKKMNVFKNLRKRWRFDTQFFFFFGRCDFQCQIFINSPVNFRRHSRSSQTIANVTFVKNFNAGWKENSIFYPTYLYFSKGLPIHSSAYGFWSLPPNKPFGFQLNKLSADFKVLGWLTNCLFWATIMVFCSSEAFIVIFSSSSSSFNRFVLIIAWWALWGWGEKAISKTSNITVKDTN